MGKKSRAKRPERADTRPPSTEAAPQVVRDTKRTAIISTLLVVTIFVVYGQVARHELTNYDDPVYVTQNIHVTTGLTLENIRWAFTSYYAGYWLPLTWISYMADVEVFGLDSGKILMTNVFLHALNSLLLFLFLRRATGATWCSGAVAALFALHPLHVESVAWATERKDVLSTFFFLLALLAYLAFLQKRSAIRYALIMIALVLGLMSKPMVVTLPFVLLLLDWWPLRRFSFSNVKLLVTEKLPLLGLIIPAALLTLKAQKPAIAVIPLIQRAENASTSYVAYLGKAFWPVKLAVIYPLVSVSPGLALLSVILLAAVTAAVLRYARRFPYLPVGWFWYLGTLVPVIGIVQAGKQSMADRFTYIPLIGIYMAIVWLIGEFTVMRRLAPAFAAVVLITCGALSYLQASHWRNTMTLVRHALHVTRNNYVAHVLLGAALAAHGDHDLAEREFETAISINPEDDEAYRNLGRLKLSSHPEEAIPFLAKAAEIKPGDSATRAMLAAAQGNKEDAVKLFQRALEEGDDTPDIHNDFAAVLAITGRDQEALAQYQEALRQMPNHYDARMNAGALLSRMGRDLEAVEQFAAAAKERPESPEPHVYLALVYANRSQIDNAIAEASQAMAIDPVASNREFTNAVRMPFKESNLRDYLAFLRSKTAANRG